MLGSKNDLTSCKIADFGLCTNVEETQNEHCGTLIYMAPEQITSNYYDCSVDVWACGIIMYILCSGGQHPLYLKNMEKRAFFELLKKNENWEFCETFPL